MEKTNIPEQQLHEVIKALAYDQSDEQIADAEGLEPEIIAQIREEQAQAIAQAKADLERGGFLA